jgi:hypothetical protein
VSTTITIIIRQWCTLVHVREVCKLLRELGELISLVIITTCTIGSPTKDSQSDGILKENKELLANYSVDEVFQIHVLFKNLHAYITIMYMYLVISSILHFKVKCKFYSLYTVLKKTVFIHANFKE